MNRVNQTHVAGDLPAFASDEETPATLRIVNRNSHYIAPRLIEPTTPGYIYIGGQVRSSSGPWCCRMRAVQLSKRRFRPYVTVNLDANRARAGAVYCRLA